MPAKVTITKLRPEDAVCYRAAPSPVLPTLLQLPQHAQIEIERVAADQPHAAYDLIFTGQLYLVKG